MALNVNKKKLLFDGIHGALAMSKTANAEANIQI